MRKTAYLGDEYSYSHAASELLAGGELCGYDTLGRTVAAASSGECDFAVVPVENNVEGAVNEVYDALYDSGLYITAQLILPIRHSLIGGAGALFSDIKRIVSHPQAIAQCRKFLLSFEHITVEAVDSTSKALRLVGGDTAAIAFRPREGQIVLKTGISDSAANATRFALLSKTPSESGGAVSVAFDLKDESGTLYNALGAIYERKINMTRILSRPHRTGSGKYRFFVDFEFSGDKDELDDTLKSIARLCTSFKCLGRYDCRRAD